MGAAIVAIDYALGSERLTNSELESLGTGWSEEKIKLKTGITTRAIASPTETASELAIKAANAMFANLDISHKDVDYLIYCTQSPDQVIPTNACMIHRQLGLSDTAGAIDVNQGCSGFIYALGLACGLIESHQCHRVLILCADTYSKYLQSDDFGVRALFGDAGSACLVEFSESVKIGCFIYGTDGEGACNLMVHNWSHLAAKPEAPYLTMNGPEIFSFTSQKIPKVVEALLTKAKLQKSDIDYWVFHQASRFILDHLREKLGIPSSQFAFCLDEIGNTVSSSIPIALKNLWDQEKIRSCQRLALVGFGVGYSWAGCIVRNLHDGPALSLKK